MSKETRKGKAVAPERNLPGRTPTRPLKSSLKLEGSPKSSTALSAESPHNISDALQDNIIMPAMKKARIGLSSTGSNSAPSTPPRVKFEEPLSKLGVRKTPTQHQQQQQEEPQTRPKSLWSFARNTKVEQDTSLINPRQVDEEVHSTFSQSTWSDPPPLHHIRVALQYLKFNALKPDSVITSGLLRLAKAMPDLFREHTISSMMIQMLRPDFTHSFKIRTNGAVVYLVCTLLHIAWDDIEDWPTDFVMAYLEDALGERSWCAIAETKQFVGNILTAFRIDDVSEDSGDDRFDPVRLDEKSSTSAVMATIDFQQYTGDLSLRKRYRDPTTRSNIKYFTLQTMWEHLPMCLGASAVDVSVRSLIKVMVITCRWVEVRMRAMGCMEFWLGSFMKSAKPLLRVVLRHISSQEMLSPEDLETWTMLLDFRYKGRSHQVEAVKEELRVAFLGLSGQVLIRSGLKHIMAMELNPNELKNPYHMDLMELLLQGISEKPAVVFGQLIRGYVVESAIQMTGTMLSPPLAPVVLVVKRWIRHLGKRSTGWNADVIIGLLQEGPHFSELAQKQEQHPGLVGRNPSVIWLQMMSEIICSVMLAAAIDAKESEEIKMSKFSISHAHAFVLQWIHAMIEQNDGAENETCRTPFGIVPLEVVRICIGRILYLDPPPSYALDSTSQEFDMALILRVIENGLPLTEQGLTALLDIRLPPKMLLAIVGDYISRAMDLSRLYPDCAVVKNPSVIVKIFNLSRFNESSNSQVLQMANDIPLAWSQGFWACALIVVMLACCNPRILALVVWDSMPVIRALLEICISQHYTFPPPNYTSRSEPITAERLVRQSLMAEQQDRETVLSWEYESLKVQGKWDQQQGSTLNADDSEYVGWLMKLDFGPSQPARAPPPEVLQQLRAMNERFGLGMKLASSRDPDYLGRMVGTNDDATWVDRLLRDVPEILNALPASTLCARYCRSILLSASVSEEADKIGKAGASSTVQVDANVKKKLVKYLENVMDTSSAALHVFDNQDVSSRFQEARDIFEYFLVRLGSASPKNISEGSSLDPDTSTSSDMPGLSSKLVRETKNAMELLFQGSSESLRWPQVLLQTIARTSGTGFVWKSMQWLGALLLMEDDIKWIVNSLDFLLKVEGDDDRIIEQSLLTIADLFLARPLVWEWIIREKEAILGLLSKRVSLYVAKADNVMDEVVQSNIPGLRSVESKIQVPLSGGFVMNTYPEIIRLILMALTADDSSKQDGSTWSRLFIHEDGSSKRLLDGQPLLTSEHPLKNDLEWRLWLVMTSRDPSLTRVALDGLNLVQLLEIAQTSFGIDIKAAQIIHQLLLTAIEDEKNQPIPTTRPDAVNAYQLTSLLKYYADHGGQVSAQALVALKAWLARDSMALSPSAKDLESDRFLPPKVELPNFFQLAANGGDESR